jgi:hypothetical protein
MTVTSDFGRQPRGIGPVFPPLFKQMHRCGSPGAGELKAVHEQFFLQREVLRYAKTLPREYIFRLPIRRKINE